MASSEPPVLSSLPPVGYGQELSTLLDLACDLELEAPLPELHVQTSSSPERGSPPKGRSPAERRSPHEGRSPLERSSPLDSRAGKGRMFQQMWTPEAVSPVSKLRGMWSPDSEVSMTARPPTAPEAASRFSRHSISRDSRGSCSSRTAAALRLGTAESSCPTHMAWSNEGSNSRMDSETPEGALLRRGSGVYSSVSPNSMHGLGPQEALDDQESIPESQQSFKSASGLLNGKVWSNTQYLIPVLSTLTLDRSLSKPGAPPRRQYNAALMKAGEKPLEAFDQLSSPSSRGSRSVSPKKSACPRQKATQATSTPSTPRSGGSGRSSKLSTLTAASQAEVRAPSRTSICATAHARGNFAKNSCTYRSDLDDRLFQFDADRADLAVLRRQVIWEAEDEERRRVDKFKAVQLRTQRIFRLQAMVNDPEVRRFFEIGRNHQPKDQPCTTPMPGFAKMQMDHPVEVNFEVKMPGQVNEKHVIEPPTELEEMQLAHAVQTKHKRSLQVRLRNLQRLHRDRKCNEEENRVGLLNEMSTDRGRRSSYTNLADAVPDLTDELQSPGSKIRRASQQNELLEAAAGCAMLPTRSLGSKREHDGNLRQTKEEVDSVRLSHLQAFREGVAAHNEKENQLLWNAFDKQDTDRSRSLDHSELRTCLAAIGLSGKNEPERQMVRQCLWSLDALQVDFEEFSEQIVPKVRDSLNTARLPRNLELFASFDIHDKQILSIEDALNGLRRLGMPMREELRAKVTRAYMFQNCEHFLRSTKEPLLELDGFIKYADILYEIIARDAYENFHKIVAHYYMVDERRNAWKHDLVDLHAQFHEYDPVSGKYGASSGLLSEKQVLTVIRESGYMPKSEGRQKKTHDMVKEFANLHGEAGEGTLSFMEFLHIMYKLREYDRERLRHICQSRTNWSQGVMKTADVYEVLQPCGLQARTHDEEWEVKAVIDEFDEDALCILSCEDCLNILQMLGRKFRLMQHEKARQYVISAGWSESHFAEFRQTFWSFDEDMSEMLDREELVKAVELLRGSHGSGQSLANMNLMLVALGIDPTKEIEIDFLTFLRMLKMLDDSESGRQQGVLLGFNQERTDTLYSVFQALEPKSDGTVNREFLQFVFVSVLKALPKAQLDDLSRMLGMEPVQVEFTSFLRLMKLIDTYQEVEFSAFVQDMLNWASEKGIHDVQEIESKMGHVHRESSAHHAHRESSSHHHAHRDSSTHHVHVKAVQRRRTSTIVEA